MDVHHTYISCFPILDTTASAIAGTAGARGLLLVVTTLVLSCVLILRKVKSKLYIPDVYANSVVCLSHLSTYQKYLKSNIYYTFKLSIKFPDKPRSTSVIYSNNYDVFVSSTVLCFCVCRCLLTLYCGHKVTHYSLLFILTMPVTIYIVWSDQVHPTYNWLTMQCSVLALCRGIHVCPLLFLIFGILTT